MILSWFKKPYHLLKRALAACESRRSACKLQPPSASETELINQLRKKINLLPPLNITAENAWMKNLNQLRQDISNKDPRGFLQWEVIGQTMFHECRELELDYLKRLPDWSRWEAAIQETAIGCPRRYPQMKTSSGNLIHSAYHLARFLSFHNLNIAKLDTIFEFGGGYGSLCRLFYKLGFQGKYIIYDLPEFSLLQEYFLESLDMGLKIITAPTAEHHKTISLISNIAELSQCLSDTPLDIFIATWSLSESPISLRQDILKNLPAPDNYLLAYQEHFGSANNKDYFSDLALHRADYTWQESAITHLPGSHYLFGKKNNA